MKKITGITILFVILVVTAFSQDTESKRTSEFEIISIHDLKLKPFVNEKEFETFVIDSIAPLYRQMKGQDLFLGKGYVGQRTGQYSIFITFETVEDRNRIYPLIGGFSEEFDKVMEGTDALWEKFRSMADGFDGIIVTDYLKLVH